MLDRIRALCKERGITVKDLENALGFGNGTIGHWKTSTPKVDRIALVANYFHVSVDYLTGASDEKSPPQGDGLNAEQREIMDLYDSLSPADRAALLATAKALAAARKSQGDR